jgi:hypothetical protein
MQYAVTQCPFPLCLVNFSVYTDSVGSVQKSARINCKTEPLVEGDSVCGYNTDIDSVFTDVILTEALLVLRKRRVK